jgi:hypothetical protein
MVVFSEEVFLVGHGGSWHETVVADLRGVRGSVDWGRQLETQSK